VKVTTKHKRISYKNKAKYKKAGSRQSFYTLIKQRFAFAAILGLTLAIGIGSIGGMLFYSAKQDVATTDEIALTGIQSSHTSRARRHWGSDSNQDSVRRDGSNKQNGSAKPQSGTNTTPKPTTPTAPAINPPSTGYISHVHIITSVFWAGETASGENGQISNVPSAWDENWATHFGGYDDPSHRNGYLPAGFTPKENPFYFALPYNDLDDNGNRRSTAGSCPEAASKQNQNVSWCKNTWMAITNETNGKTCYAQWEDAGPYGENDVAYVFGTAGPANTRDLKAGLDVSPAARDCLGMGDEGKATWSFINAANVPAGPWKQIITTTPSYTVD
jgi:hypothetical protein